MLVDVPCRSERIQQGVYKSRWWNFELEFRSRQDFALDYPDLGSDFDAFGVCDSPEQLVGKLPASVAEGPNKYVVSMVEVRRSDEPPEGGWRWHKWGGYIGDKTPTTEYLHDEPEIDAVWTYHVYAVE